MVKFVLEEYSPAPVEIACSEKALVMNVQKGTLSFLDFRRFVSHMGRSECVLFSIFPFFPLVIFLLSVLSFCRFVLLSFFFFV